MTSVVAASNSDVTTPTSSYVSRWIAQSHGGYAKKSNDFYAFSSPTSTLSSAKSDFRTSIHHGTSPTTTWQAQARLKTENDLSMCQPTSLNNNLEFQEKMTSIRALLNAKKQRFHRQCSTTSMGDSKSFCSDENVFDSHDEQILLNNSIAQHHLPSLIEESPSDSGCSEETKATNVDDLNDSTGKSSAIIDLTKPLSKEQMLAIVQIIRELWRKQFGSEMFDAPKRTTNSPINPKLSSPQPTLINEHNKKMLYRSTPSLNKLTAELSDIKDKLKRFSNGRSTNEKQVLNETNNEDSRTNFIPGDCLVFIPIGPPLTNEDLERMQRKKELLIRRQMQRREEQILRKNQRLMVAAQQKNDYRFYENFLEERRQIDERRRKTILQAHIDQKRREADPPSSHDYYFGAARTRQRLKRKTSIHSFDDEFSLAASTFDLNSPLSSRRSKTTPKRNAVGFEFVSSSLTASTAASRSKMNRAASICNLNDHYDSFTSLNSKATVPKIRQNRLGPFFGGSLMNINLLNSKGTKPSLDDPFDLIANSPLTGSLSSLNISNPTASKLYASSTRLGQSQIHLPSKSNKQTITNALKQVVLAGSNNEQQCEIIIKQIQQSESRHFIILFRDHRLQFRSIYAFIPDTDVVEKIHGVGPNVITETMVEKWFKYNSGSKRFTNIPIRHFSIQCDAITIYNDFWQKKFQSSTVKLL